MEEKLMDKKVKDFKIFGPISFLYALFFVYCLYKNLAGITSPLWTIATVAYIKYMAKKFDKKWKGLNTFFSIEIILLGLSNFLTANWIIIFFNYVGIMTLIIFNMMYLFIDKKSSSIVRYLETMFLILGGMIEKIYEPFEQCFYFLKKYKSSKSKNIFYILIGLCIALPLVIILIMLLSSADIVFNNMMESFWKMLNIEFVLLHLLGISVMLIVGYMVPYLFSKKLSAGDVTIKEEKLTNAKAIIPIVITGCISFVYGMFSVVQIVYLFMGKGQIPEGYTYAQYAREGFFQLLVVCLFNILLILICLEFFEESKLLKILLTLISASTFIMIASSLFRMKMYIGEYGLTTFRVLVLWSLLVILLVMIGYLVRIFSPKMDMVRYSLIVVTLCYTVLSLGRMDAHIAGYNIKMYSEINNFQAKHEYLFDNYVDYSYVFSLSTDAAPVIMKHMPEIKAQMKENKSWEGNPLWCNKKYRGYLTHYNFVTVRKLNFSSMYAKYHIENKKRYPSIIGTQYSAGNGRYQIYKTDDGIAYLWDYRKDKFLLEDVVEYYDDEIGNLYVVNKTKTIYIILNYESRSYDIYHSLDGKGIYTDIYKEKIMDIKEQKIFTSDKMKKIE